MKLRRFKDWSNREKLFFLERITEASRMGKSLVDVVPDIILKIEEEYHCRKEIQELQEIFKKNK